MDQLSLLAAMQSGRFGEQQGTGNAQQGTYGNPFTPTLGSWWMGTGAAPGGGGTGQNQGLMDLFTQLLGMMNNRGGGGLTPTYNYNITTPQLPGGQAPPTGQTPGGRQQQTPPNYIVPGYYNNIMGGINPGGGVTTSPPPGLDPEYLRRLGYPRPGDSGVNFNTPGYGQQQQGGGGGGSGPNPNATGTGLTAGQNYAFSPNQQNSGIGSGLAGRNLNPYG